jgi:lipopolysaccharide/colanic/teichoic acid biosynthesis glycosyltransferase
VSCGALECSLDNSCRFDLGKASGRKQPRILIEQAVAWGALFLLSVPIFLTAVLTAFTLGKPILFRQRRIGLDGQSFTIYKFRTMRNTTDCTGKLLPDTMRETKLSRLLRRIRLDELPQLLAIAKGKMAFIGPRPLLPETIQSMGPLGCCRCRVRPGLSGWAQINGNTKLSDIDKLSLDLWYIDHQTLRMDITILVKTLQMITAGETVNHNNLKKAQQYVGIQYGLPTKSSVGTPR